MWENISYVFNYIITFIYVWLLIMRFVICTKHNRCRRRRLVMEEQVDCYVFDHVLLRHSWCCVSCNYATTCLLDISFWLFTLHHRGMFSSIDGWNYKVHLMSAFDHLSMFVWTYSLYFCWGSMLSLCVG